MAWALHWLVGIYNIGDVGLSWKDPRQIQVGLSKTGPSLQQHQAAARALKSFKDTRTLGTNSPSSLDSVRARSSTLKERQADLQLKNASGSAVPVKVSKKRSPKVAAVVLPETTAKKAVTSAGPLIGAEKKRKEREEDACESLEEALPMWQRPNTQMLLLDKSQCQRVLAALRIDSASHGVVHMRGLIKTALSEIRTQTQDDEALEDSVAYEHPSSHNESIESQRYQPSPPGSYGQGHIQQPMSEPGHSRQSIGQGYHQPYCSRRMGNTARATASNQ